MHKTVEYLRRQSKRQIVLLCLSLVVLTGLGDYLAGPEIGLSLFYLVPISLATWFAGTSVGVLTAVSATLVWFTAKWIGYDVSLRHFPTIWNAMIRLGFFMVIVFLQHTLQQEQLRARRDQLTGGSNRLHFLELAELELTRARRYQHPISLAYIDLDNFKAVNDQYGHGTGDGLLRLVMQTIQHNIRTTDTIARLGGDEYALLLPETGSEPVVDVIEKLHRRLSEAMKKRNLPVTFSIGVATFMNPPATIDALLKTADRLMYSAKEKGKNQIQYATYGNDAVLKPL